MATTRTVQAALRGRRILVAEDEYMIAQEIAEELSNVGAETLGPVSRVEDAAHLIDTEGWIDGALLDVNLNNEVIWPIVDFLLAHGVPLLLTTGYDASAIPTAYLHLPRCEKPATGQDLTHALARILNAPTPSTG